MGKKDKNKKKGKGAEKTAAKTEKKLSNKQKKELAALGEVSTSLAYFGHFLNLFLSNTVGEYRKHCSSN